jgi:hypothetical protein
LRKFPTDPPKTLYPPLFEQNPCRIFSDFRCRISDSKTFVFDEIRLQMEGDFWEVKMFPKPHYIWIPPKSCDGLRTFMRSDPPNRGATSPRTVTMPHGVSVGGALIPHPRLRAKIHPYPHMGLISSPSQTSPPYPKDQLTSQAKKD